MTDGLHLTPREVAQVEAALDEPTLIDPADIRPGDFVRMTQEFEVEKRGPSGTLHGCGGQEFRPMAASQLTWHLIHRPDPDAEVVDALILAASTGPDGEPDYDRTTPEKILARLREQGWDVVRRSES